MQTHELNYSWKNLDGEHVMFVNGVRVDCSIARKEDDDYVLIAFNAYFFG